MTPDDMQRTVLRTTLALAVPMHIAELDGLPPDVLTGIATRAATTVGTHGDDLQFGGRHCAEAFNALARGLAVAALTAWGGVTWEGMRWCRVPRCPGPDGPHPEHTLWQRTAETRPVVDLPLSEEGERSAQQC